jgi:acylpyruvate hydrolase
MKIICIGRNYADHAREMAAEIPKQPMFFLKPDVALLKESAFYYPPFTEDLHYECELVVKIDKPGKQIDKRFAHRYFSTISLGIDFTARDLQQACKKNGHPWEISKSFDNSAPISNSWLSVDDINLDELSFRLEKNGETVQIGHTRDMIFNVSELISYVSKFITLKTGDLIFTGTPSGVGPVKIGDILTGYIGDKQMFEINVK